MITTEPVGVPDARGTDDEALKRRAHEQLLDDGAELASLPRSELSQRVAASLRELAPLLDHDRFERLRVELLDEVGGLGPLEPFLGDPSISEVMVNGDGTVFVERAGRLEHTGVAVDADRALLAVERVVSPLGLRLDRSSPMVEARLADGSRLHAVIPPLAPDGPAVTIRRFRVEPVPLEAFAPGREVFLRTLVARGWNLLVTGGTSTGKTTLLNALAGAIPESERVVTIEETAELRLGHANLVRLEARPANAEGVGAVSVRALLRAALRMRPDRIIVGEVRGGEAFDMLQALNTGHDGSLSTLHANGPDDALARLETLALLAGVGLPLAALRRQIVASLDAVVHVVRIGGERVVAQVAEVRDREGVPVATPLVARQDGTLVAVGRPTRRPRRARA